MKREIIDASKLELEDKVVAIKRVTKVVKGGRNSRVAALVVVGDRNGHVGVGVGKAVETPEAIRKGKEDAAKHLVTVPVNEARSGGVIVSSLTSGYYNTYFVGGIHV